MAQHAKPVIRNSSDFEEIDALLNDAMAEVDAANSRVVDVLEKSKDTPSADPGDAGVPATEPPPAEAP